MSGSGGGLFQRLRARRWKPQWQKSFDSQQEKTFQVNHLLKLACGSRYFTCDYVTLHVSSPALYTFIIHDRHKHINTDPMAPREVLFFFGSWRDLRYFCVCTTSRPPPANCPQHDWMIESVRVKCTSRNGMNEDDFIQNLTGARLLFLKKKLEQLTRHDTTELWLLGFILPWPNTPSHSVSVAYPRSESDLLRGLTRSSSPMLHTSTNFYENKDHCQLQSATLVTCIHWEVQHSNHQVHLTFMRLSGLSWAIKCNATHQKTYPQIDSAAEYWWCIIAESTPEILISLLNLFCSTP